MIQNYFKIAFRHLMKNKLFTSIKLLGLTAGVNAVLLIGLYLQNELTYDNCHEKRDRIVKVNMEYSFGGETNQANVTGNKVAPVFKKDFPEVEAAVRVINLPQVVKIGGDLFEEEGIYFADDSFFEIFTFPFIAGNLETALDEPFRVVLTETKAKQYFGDQNPLGETIEIAGLEASISGIMQDPPGNTHIKPDIVVSFSSLPQSKPENETFWNANYATYFLLKNVSNIASLEAKIPDYMQQFSEEIGSDSRLTYHLLPLEKIHLESPVPGNFEPNGGVIFIC